MKTKNILYTAFTALAMAASLSMSAQKVDILGVTDDGQRAQIKAKVDLAGKKVKSVTTYSYYMVDGYTVTNTAHEFVQDGENTYLTADVFYYPENGRYRYRIELVFDDNTKYMTSVVDSELSEEFMWLGDYNYIEAKSGWDDQHPPVVDREIDPSLQFLLDGVRYYKGVDNHAPGYIIYDFGDTPFTRFVTRYGVQDDRTDGDVGFKFFTGTDPTRTAESQMTSRWNQTMYSLTNPSRGNAPCVADLDLDMTGYSVLRVTYDQIDNNWGDHGHLAMARLYLPVEKVHKNRQTVTFTNAETALNGPIILDATSSSGGKVFYRIISGRDIATIEDGVLTPVWGGKGNVVVEATQYGDDDNYPATDYHTFSVDLQPQIQFLNVYHPSVPQADGRAYAYLLVDSKGRKISKLSAVTYNDLYNLKKIDEKPLLSKYSPSKGKQVIEIELPAYSDQVLQLVYRYEGSDVDQVLPYWHSRGAFDYISDMPASTYRLTAGWGSPSAPNKSFNGDNNGQLNIVANPDVNYAKGFGVHAKGSLEVQPEALAPYERVAADMGAQKGYGGNLEQTMAYRIESGNMVLKTTQTLDSTTGSYVGGDLKKSQYVSWETPINNSSILRLIIEKGSDGRDDNDHVCIGAPRLYHIQPVKTGQNILWTENRRVVNNKETRITLDAEASSGNTPLYYIVNGSQYASIENGNTLVIHEFPNGGDKIVVDAYEPGDDVFDASNVATCTFEVLHGLEVQRDEYVELNESDVFDELIIHADSKSSGQVNVKNALVDVRKIVLKYTFTPYEWSYISFPSDLDIDAISNLKELGYNYSAFSGPAYYIRELNTVQRSLSPETGGFVDLDSPKVKALKGYIMMVDDSKGSEPVEVTFTIDNTHIDLTELARSLGLTIDFTGMKPDTKKSITVSSANPNVKSNSLTIEVTFKPEDLSSLPLNHAQALERMRYVFVGQNRAIRLTLPDQTPARVVFFDADGKKVVKAVRYVAPNVIDLKDMKSGKYNMMVQYGPATKNYEIEL